MADSTSNDNQGNGNPNSADNPFFEQESGDTNRQNEESRLSQQNNVETQDTQTRSNIHSSRDFGEGHGEDVTDGGGADDSTADQSQFTRGNAEASGQEAEPTPTQSNYSSNPSEEGGGSEAGSSGRATDQVDIERPEIAADGFNNGSGLGSISEADGVQPASNGFGNGDQEAPGNSGDNNDAENEVEEEGVVEEDDTPTAQVEEETPPAEEDNNNGNNGFGNGDQDAPGNSGDNNNAENAAEEEEPAEEATSEEENGSGDDGPQGNNGFGNGDQDAPGNSEDNNNAENAAEEDAPAEQAAEEESGNGNSGNGGPQGNNGFGNGDQDAPGGSEDNNNAENAGGNQEEVVEYNVIEGNNGNNSLEGTSGNDQIDGGKGNDQITGGDGDDILLGGDGSDTLTFLAQQGNDIVDGGAGGDWTDTIDLSGVEGGEASWTIVLNDDSSENVDESSEFEMVLSGDAGGTITFGDGGSIDFENIEKIVW